MFVFIECTNEQKIWVIKYIVETFFKDTPNLGHF